VAGRTALSAAFPTCGFPTLRREKPSRRGDSSETFQVLKTWKVYQGREKLPAIRWS